MKVLHFFKSYCPDTMGGIEQVIFQLAEGGVRHGIEAEVLYLSKRGAARNEPLGQHMTHRSKLNLELASTTFSLSALADFIELARQADVIHYHFPWPFMDLVHFFASTGKPAVVSYHSDIVKQKYLLKLYQPLMHKFLSSVDAVVTSSPNYADSSAVLRQHKERVYVIPFGLDEATYPVPTEARLAYWLDRYGQRFFLFVGVLRYYKGLTWLLQAAALNGLPVVIVGGGGIDAELKAQAAALGVEHVHFAGRVDDADKVALLMLCYAFVFPSHLRSEAFGISLLEAAMYGKPLISCEIGTGTSYINQAGETGLVVPPADPSALCAAMTALWEDPQMAHAMGKQARLRFEQVFSAEQMVSAYAHLYRCLL